MRSAIDRDHWLDSLAKSLAGDVSRKAFLGVLGSTALALLVPGLGRVAQAQMRRCRAGCTDRTFPDCCDGVCTNVSVDAANCQTCGQRCGAGEICRQGQCLTPDPLGPQCDPPCGPNEVCKPNLAQQRDVCCGPPFLCGNACYDTPRVQCQGGACCGTTQTCCQGSVSWYCCDPGSTCLPGDSPADNVSPCCPNDQVCNGECCRGPSECLDGSCWPTCDCPEGHRCLDSGGTPFGSASHYSGPPDPPVCCPMAEVWDTGTYYGSDRIGRGMCCKEEHRWSVAQASGEAYLCCPPEERWERFARCCPPRDRWERLALCCPPEERWEGPGTCGCPPRDRWEGPGLCCPPEERWEGPGTCGCPPRDRWEGPGLCCPPERRCGQNVCCPEYERCNAQNICDACPALDLNGLWEDNGRRVRIVHQRQAPDQPQSVVATYVQPHTCHHQDGSGRTSRTLLDFRATLRCRILTGEVTVCFWGQRSNPGFRLSAVTLTADLDGTSLSGKWENEEGTGSITLKRLDAPRRGTPSPPRGR
jgi:hypothetical protein